MVNLFDGLMRSLVFANNKILCKVECVYLFIYIATYLSTYLCMFFALQISMLLGRDDR